MTDRRVVAARSKAAQEIVVALERQHGAVAFVAPRAVLTPRRDRARTV